MKYWSDYLYKQQMQKKHFSGRYLEHGKFDDYNTIGEY